MKNIIISATALIGLLNITACSPYSESTSKRLVYYSAAAFCKESTLTNWNCGDACKAVPGLTQFTPVSDPSQSTFGYIGYDTTENEIIVAFRGSHNLDNWISNMNFFKTPYPNSPSNSQVHRGFY